MAAPPALSCRRRDGHRRLRAPRRGRDEERRLAPFGVVRWDAHEPRHTHRWLASRTTRPGSEVPGGGGSPVRRRLVPLLLVVLVACGQDADGIGRTASAALAPQVQLVRASLTNGDRAGAERRLDELRRTVAELRQRGELSDKGAAKILDAAAEVEARLGSGTPSATTVSPTTLSQRDTRGTTRTTRRS